MNNHFEFICYRQEISDNKKVETKTHFLNYMNDYSLKFMVTQIF